MYTRYRLKAKSGFDTVYLDVLLEYERPLKVGEKIGILDYPGTPGPWEVLGKAQHGDVDVHVPRKGDNAYKVAYVSGLDENVGEPK